jgi:hypothetical protein
VSRPSKIAPDLVAAIAESVRAGHAGPAVASAIGIGERTLYRWLARGRATRRCSECPCRSTCTRPADELYVTLDFEVLKARSALVVERAQAMRFAALSRSPLYGSGPTRCAGRRVAESDAWPMPTGGAP